MKFASKKDGIEATILDEGNELSRGNCRRKNLLVLKINWELQVPRGIMKLGKVKKTYAWQLPKNERSSIHNNF